MNDSLELRPATSSDADPLWALAMRAKAHWGYSAEFMSACRDELRVTSKAIEDPQLSFVVAHRGEELAGFYTLEMLADGEGELSALFVDPPYIGQGIGRQLLLHAITKASQNGADRILIQSDPDSADFYRAAGGVDVGQRESGSVPGRFLPVLAIATTDP